MKTTATMKVTIDYGSFQNKAGVEYEAFFVKLYACTIRGGSGDFGWVYYEAGEFQTVTHIEEFRTLKAAKLWCKRHGYDYKLSFSASVEAIEGVD